MNRQEPLSIVHPTLDKRNESFMPVDSGGPAADASDGMEADSLLRATSSAALNILVVEDDAQSRDLVCDMLAILGHPATGVASAEEALQALADANFHVLLADIDLPGMSGLELAAKAVQQVPSLRVIFASGYVTTAGPGEQPNSIMLPKPFDLMELKDALADIA